MQVYSSGHLYFGIIIGLAGIIPLRANLFALAKRKRVNSYKDIKSIATSFLCMLYGVYWISKAYDPPHQEAQRTDVISHILLLIFVATVIFLYFAKRLLPKHSTV